LSYLLCLEISPVPSLFELDEKEGDLLVNVIDEVDEKFPAYHSRTRRSRIFAPLRLGAKCLFSGVVTNQLEA
jgi:hypothetical protein